MFPSQSFPRLVSNDRIPWVLADEKTVNAAREGVRAIAERNAALRLIATCELIAASMSVTEQPAMHKRLVGDVEALKSFLEPSA